MGILNLLGIGKPKNDASALYAQLVKQARRPVFYTAFGVPDTVNGRYDVIMLHAYFVMKRLREIGPDGRDLSQALFDYMFSDMDKNLREMGVGDLSVGKKIKTMATAFYGRIKAYDEGLGGGKNALEEALNRNLFVDSEPNSDQLASAATYLARQVEASLFWALSDLESANFDFIAPDDSL